MSLLSSDTSAAVAFRLPVSTDGRAWRPRGSRAESTGGKEAGSIVAGRLSSFGFSGTIAHGLFGCSQGAASSAGVARRPCFGRWSTSLLRESVARTDDVASLTFRKLVTASMEAQVAALGQVECRSS